MKIPVAVLACLLSVGSLSAKLSPTAVTTAYAHLAEVNARWLVEASPEAFLRDAAFADETARIRYHLLAVHGILSARETSRLSAKQRAARQASLAELLAYAQRGRFPLNTAHPARTPYFVDADGTHCAVGYLMYRAGDAALVEDIRSRNNNGYVLQDLLRDPAVGTWAVEHGFTAEELAWIQPGYPGNYLLKPQPFGRGLGVRGGQVLAAAHHPDYGSYLAGDFTDLDGVPARGLVRVEGTRVTPVPNDFGRITQLTVVPDADVLVCIGSADASAPATRVSLYQMSSATFVASWDLPGEPRVYVHADSAHHPMLFVGAMREATDTIAVFALALDSLRLSPAAPGYTLTGAIYDSYTFMDNALLGGAFRVTDATGAAIDSNQVRYDYVRDAFLADDNAINPLSGGSLRHTNRPVYRFFGVQSSSYLDQRSLSGDYLTINVARDSFELQHFSVESGPRSVWMESRHSNATFAIGGDLAELSAFSDDGLLISGKVAPPGAPLDPHDDTRLIATSMSFTMFFYTQEIPIDGTLSAVVRTGDSLLLAGDFTMLAGAPVQQLAYARPEVTDVPPAPVLRVGARVTAGELHLDLGQALARDGRLFLYSSDGRLVQTAVVPAGQQAPVIPLSVAGGALHFAIATEGGVGAGTVVVHTN